MSAFFFSGLHSLYQAQSGEYSAIMSDVI